MARSQIPSTDRIFEIFSRSETLAACIIIISLIFVLRSIYGKKKYKLPPGPIGLPILGYLPFLGREPYKELDRLKEIYGNVFSLYLGGTYTIILGDYEAVKDGLGKSTTTDRPPRIFDFLPDGVGLSSVNGLEWTEQRKFCVKTMKEHGIGSDRWESIIQVEVEDFVEFVSSTQGAPVDVSERLTSSVSNNISTFVFGKHLPYSHPDRKLLDNIVDDIMLYFAQSSLSNFYPIIRDVSIALGFGSFADMHHKLLKFNNFVREQVKKLSLRQEKAEAYNFIVDYLKEMEKCKDKSGYYFNDTNLHGNIQALFLAGSETTRTSIYWLLLSMANFPEVQQKVHSEIDKVLGKDCRIRWPERKKLPYTLAVIMEGQRWRTVAPLNTARITTEDMKIQGYDVPKGTTIIANNWGLHNDTRYWNNPEEFRPERFLTDDGQEIRSKIDSYNPFSYGKRNCPGERIAMMEILLYFTALMQKFNVVPPEGKQLNMDGVLGLTYQAIKQELQFLPRG